MPQVHVESAAVYKACKVIYECQIITGKKRSSLSLSLSLFFYPSYIDRKAYTRTVFSIAEVQPWQKDQDGLEHEGNAAETVLESSGDQEITYSILSIKAKVNPTS